VRPLRLLFNADDFGHSQTENRAIGKTVLHGPVRSVSVLANFAESAEIATLLRLEPRLGVGVHLNLNEGPPVLLPARVASLVDCSGNFWPKGVFLRKLFSGRISLSEVEAELTAQIAKVLTLTEKVSHIDSHQNVHILPRIATAVASACLSVGLVKIRSQKEVYLNDHTRMRKKPLLRQMKRLLRDWGQKRILRYGLMSPVPLLQGMPGYLQESNEWQESLYWWEKTLSCLPQGAYEICLHPGLSPAQTTLLTSAVFKDLLESSGCRTVNYFEV
jgi:predicted glycoside hydrolase/deacetylase ChbG (UPF0249 family)